MQKLETEEQCRRLARTICSDISLYQKQYLEQAKSGLPVPKQLEDAIEEGRTLFLARAAPAFAHWYDTSLLDILGIALNTAPAAPVAVTPPAAPAPAPKLPVPTAVTPSAASSPAMKLPEPAAVVPSVAPPPVSSPPAPAAVMPPVAVDPAPELSDRQPAYEETGIFSKVAAIVVLAAVIASAVYFFILR